MERWSDHLADGVKAWSDNVACIVADALMDGGVITEDALDRATAIIAEEIFARLCVRDYPPRDEADIRDEK
jgi:hypothetical protein